MLFRSFNDGSITSFVNVNSATTLGKINNVLTQYLLLGATNPGTGNYSTGSYGSTGWQIVNYEVVTAGTYKLGFAAFNQGDTALSPVLYVNDGLGTVTKNGAPFNSVAPNDPNMPTSPGSTPSAPTVVSTAPTTSLVSSSTAYGTPTTSNLILVASTNTGSLFNVSKTTTHIIGTPYTITTITTPQVIQTWSDNTTTTIADPNNPATTATQTGTAYQTGVSTTETKSASASGSKDAIAHRNMNLFLIDPLATRDGAWAAPSMSRGGGFNTSGATLGWQRTIDNNTFGFAVNYTEGNSKGYNNSDTSTNSAAGTAYILSRQPWIWFKAAAGFSQSNHNTNVSISEFNLSNASKVRQNNYYADFGVYAPTTFYGIRPLAGVLVNTWSLSGTETGSPMLSSLPANGNHTRASPYAGARIELNDTFALETKVITNTDYKNVISNRLTASKPITSNVSLNATIGFDKSFETKYNNVYGLRSEEHTSELQSH